MNIRSILLPSLALLAAWSCTSPGSGPRSRDLRNTRAVEAAPALPGSGLREASLNGPASSTLSASAGRTSPAPRTAPLPGMVSVVMNYPTGDEGTSAVRIEKTSPGQSMVGQSFDYEILVTNLTTLDLDAVELREAYSDGFGFLSADPSPSSVDPGFAAWNVGLLRAGESERIRVTGRVVDAGSVSSCSTVSYESGLCMVVDVVQPELTIRTNAPQETLLCDPVEVVYTVSNTGTGVARGVTVAGNLANGLTTDRGDRAFTQEVGDLASGESRQVRVTAIGDGPGTYEHQAYARSIGGLEAKTERTSTTVRAPLLTVEIDGRSGQFVGREIRYEIRVSNSGDAAAEDATLTHVVPRGAQFVEAADSGRLDRGSVVWALGTVQPGETVTTSLVLRGDAIGDLDVSAATTADCARSASASITSALRGAATPRLEVIDFSDPCLVGEEETYQIQVTNQGTASATGIRIECELPENVTYVSSRGATAPEDIGTTITFSRLAVLPPGGEATWRVVVRANSSADARFKVSLTSDQYSRPVEEHEPTTYYE